MPPVSAIWEEEKERKNKKGSKEAHHPPSPAGAASREAERRVPRAGRGREGIHRRRERRDAQRKGEEEETRLLNNFQASTMNATGGARTAAAAALSASASASVSGSSLRRTAPAALSFIPLLKAGARGEEALICAPLEARSCTL